MTGDPRDPRDSAEPSHVDDVGALANRMASNDGWDRLRKAVAKAVAASGAASEAEPGSPADDDEDDEAHRYGLIDPASTGCGTQSSG